MVHRLAHAIAQPTPARLNPHSLWRDGNRVAEEGMTGPRSSGVRRCSWWLDRRRRSWVIAIPDRDACRSCASRSGSSRLSVGRLASYKTTEAPRADASDRPMIPDPPHQTSLGDRTGATANVPETPARVEAAETQQADRVGRGASRRRRRSGAFGGITAKADLLLMTAQFSAAHLAFQTAAMAGDPRGARGLARTFD